MNPYRFKIPSMMGVIGSAILGMPFSGYAAQPDSCGPDFSTIHDFKVGDVFERYSVKWSWHPEVNDDVHFSKIIRKYTVVSAQKSGKAKTYDISGIELRINGFWKGGETHTAGKSSRNFQERLEYIDSGTNFLNQCKGEIVSADTSDSDATLIKTKIQVASGVSNEFPLGDDSTSLKWIGGEELGKYAEDGTMDGKIVDVTFKAVYAKELGLVSYRSGGGFSFPFTDEVKLTGYVKNGRTVGIVTPDHVLMDVTAIRNKNFANSLETRMASKTKSGYQFDVLGREPSVRKTAKKSFLVLKRP